MSTRQPAPEWEIFQKDNLSLSAVEIDLDELELEPDSADVLKASNNKSEKDIQNIFYSKKSPSNLNKRSRTAQMSNFWTKTSKAVGLETAKKKKGTENAAKRLIKSLTRVDTIREVKEQEFKYEVDFLFKVPPDLEMAKQHGEAQRARLHQSGINQYNCKCP